MVSARWTPDRAVRVRVLAWVAGPTGGLERGGGWHFRLWPGSLSCVLGQDTLLSQCLSPPRSINEYRKQNAGGDELASHPGVIAIDIPTISRLHTTETGISSGSVDQFGPRAALPLVIALYLSLVQCVPRLATKQRSNNSIDSNNSETEYR